MESSAERASNNHAINGPRGVLDLVRNEERHTRVAGLEGVFVEENSAVVLRDHVENCLAATCCCKNAHLPARRQYAKSHRDGLPANSGPNPDGVWDSRKEAVPCQMAFCSSDPDARLDWQGEGTAAASASVPALVLDRGGQAMFSACSLGRTAAHAKHRTSRCHLRDNKRRRLPRGVASGSQLPESQQMSCQRLRQQATGCLAAS